jgi:hypothetical protein
MYIRPPVVVVVGCVQELRELTPPPVLTEEEEKTKAKLERLMTSHFYGAKTYGPKNPIPLWYKEDGGVV